MCQATEAQSGRQLAAVVGVVGGDQKPAAPRIPSLSLRPHRTLAHLGPCCRPAQHSPKLQMRVLYKKLSTEGAQVAVPCSV